MKDKGLPATRRRKTRVRVRRISRAGKRPPRAGRHRNAVVPNAQTHGLTTEADKRNELPAGFEYLQQQVDAFVRGSLLDDGGDGDEEIPTRRRAHHGYRGRIHRRILQVDEALQRYGLFDRRGKLRVAWITKLESLISTAIRIDVLLGLQRRPRKIESPIEWLQRRADEARQTDTDTTDSHRHDDSHDSADSITERGSDEHTSHEDSEQD